MLAEALNRTTLLMRTELREDVAEPMLVDALAGLTVVISADSSIVETAPGRTAVVTAALLMARSGHRVWIDCPDASMTEPQPPLAQTRLHDALRRAGADLLPDRTIEIGSPAEPVHFAVVFGKGQAPSATDVLYIGASDWSASLSAVSPRDWTAAAQPFGAMAAGALAASEAFKVAMRGLAPFARSRQAYDRMFAAATEAVIDLAPAAARPAPDVGVFDLVSGGAIANAALFTLLRTPGILGRCRVIDNDESALSNLNRNALLLRSGVGRAKVEDLARHGHSLEIQPVVERYREGQFLGAVVLLGVDDIPSRWAAQRQRPDWLGVGATAGFAVQISSHDATTPCAGCLHPVAGDTDGPIPTVAFVSFWAGLLLAVRLLFRQEDRILVGDQTWFSPLRPEGWSYAKMGLSAHADCPVGCDLLNCGEPTEPLTALSSGPGLKPTTYGSVGRHG